MSNELGALPHDAPAGSSASDIDPALVWSISDARSGDSRKAHQ
jgi:hypothetical protein